MFKSSQITPAFRSKTFDNFTTEGKPQIIKDLSNCGFHYLRNFKKEDGQWLVALGQPGSGKTHISMAVSNELIKRFIPVLYFQHVEGMKELVSIISKNGDISEKKERMKTVDVLYWDDLFKPPKQPTAFDIETAFEVLNYRYLNLLPTIISSERTPEQLAMIDEATGSRIIERSRGHLVVLEGKGLNYRLEA